MTLIKNKKLIFLLLFSIFLCFCFAGDLDGLKTPFTLGGDIIKMIKDLMNPIGEAFKGNYSNVKGKLSALAKGLFLVSVSYELAKTYLEGSYNELPVKLCTTAFKYIAVGTFLGIGGDEGTAPYYFSIPAELISLGMGNGVSSSSIDPSITDPLSSYFKAIGEIFTSWDSAGTFVASQFTLALTKMSALLDVIDGLCYLILACLEALVLIIGYFILTLGIIGPTLKIIEICIALPITIIFLAGKMLNIGEQYFNISFKYIIAAIMDLGIITLVSKFAVNLLAGKSYLSLIDMLLGLFNCIIVLVLLKFAPKIGSGIINGSPSIKMSDVGDLTNAVSGAVAGVGVAGGIVGAAAGAAKGAMSGGASGGLIGAIAGASKGAQSGAKTGAKMATAKMGGNIGEKALNALK